MTGEITLRGEVLTYRRIKEKIISSSSREILKNFNTRAKCKDLVDIPDEIKDSLEIIPVRWIDQVIELALTRHQARKR